MNRSLLEAILALTSGSLSLLTVVAPDWIEAVFRFDPDHYSGVVEWLVCAVLAAAAIILAAHSVSLHRHADNPTI